MGNQLSSTSETVSVPCVVDVAIIGSGFAGLAAAIEASNKNAGQIVILEKQPTPGGNSIMNAGQVAAVGTNYQSGIDDSIELMTADLLKAGVDLNHPNLLRKMISESKELVNWTETELGVKYRTRVTQLGGHSVPRTLSTVNATGKDIIRPMLDKVEEMSNIRLLTRTEFHSFVMSNDGKSVKGIVVVVDKQSKKTILCRRGVVLAAGGFSADVDFRSIQNPSFDQKVMTTNQPGATAEVLKEALKIGAMPVQLSRIQLGPWTSPDEGGFGMAPFFCIGAGFPYGIIVNPDTGKRFVNELGNRYERSMAIIKMGHPVVCFTDSVGAEHSLEKDLSKCHRAVKSFETISELAEAYGMDSRDLQQSIDEYNEGVAVGKDAFGKPLRSDLGPIVKPPFYATRLWPKVHHTMGGVQIDEYAHVIHIDGHPIEGLFAAGEFAGGVHGGDRLGSCATLDCLSFGRIAGRSAATRDPIEFEKEKILSFVR